MDLLQLWTLVRRGWLLILIAVLGGIFLGAGISYMQPRIYSATTTGYVVAGASSSLDAAVAGKSLASEKAASYLPLVESRSVAETVAKEVGVPSEQVKLTGENKGVIFTITAQASSPELAKQMADTGIRATSIVANDLETMTVSGESTGATVVKIVPVEPALTPTNPVSPNWTRNVVLGVALGLLVGFGILVLRQSLDRRIRVASEVEEIVGASTLGVLPLVKELGDRPVRSGSQGEASEALRKLRTNLRFVAVDKSLKAIVITSPNEGEGKSTVAAHLATLMAESGRRTILVDGDLRRPNVARMFGVDGSVGLSQVLADAAPLSEVLIPVGENLQLLPSGQLPPNPSELVGSDRMQAVIANLARNATVIIDAPPLLPVTDAGLLTAASDGALLVVNFGSTRRDHVALAARNVDTVDGTILGIVMNKVPKKDIGSAVYGYGAGYSQSYHHRSDDGGLASSDAPLDEPSVPRNAKPPKRAV